MSKKRENPIYPIHISYRLDSFLMYHIQDVTKRPTIEIINFFHELSTQIADIGQKNRTGSGIHKKIDDYFPGTSIPFHLEMKGHANQGGRWDPSTRTYVRDEATKFNCSVEIGFPDRSTYIDSKVFDEIGDFLMERELLGVDVPADSPANQPFVRPDVKSSKMYKDLMDLYAGRPVEEKKRKKRKTKDEQQQQPTP